MWCWHPTHIHPRTPIREENYHCCCKLGKAKIGFAVFLILDAVFLAFLILSVILGTPDARLPTAMIFAFCLPIMFLGIMALITQKPMFMQAYGVAYIVQLVLLTLSILTYTFIYLSDTEGKATDFPRANEDPHSPKQVRYTVSIAVGALIFLFLRGWITLNYYKFVRDRQLALETVGHSLTSRSDVEYQEGKLVR
ncbi:unnamed protein product, partial [Mesorhabditis spiculigera]